jgi:prepilin-type N-terminal cleavage/methylation domain-containing protein
MIAKRIQHHRTGRRGFTLIEVLLAVSLSAMLLVAVNFFVLSLGELWSGGASSRLFERHIRGVTRFLEALFQQTVPIRKGPTEEVVPNGTDKNPKTSGWRLQAQPALAQMPRQAQASYCGPCVIDGMRLLAVANFWWRQTFALPLAQTPGIGPGGQPRQRPSSPGSGTAPPPPPGGAVPSGQNRINQELDVEAGPRFEFATPHGYDGGPPLLMFEVDEAPGQCIWPARPLPWVACALQVNKDEGLVLLWKSKLEEDYGKARPRKTQLSPFAKEISFDYYDSKNQKWSHTDAPQRDDQGEYVAPQRIRITFTYEGQKREVAIALPEAMGGAPLR